MQVHNFEKAAGAFGECICIDDTQGEVWGNLAACYMNMKRMKEAYSTL
jgi:Flp pilus assembly protein TadD